jgi:hypothetical protein
MPYREKNRKKKKKKKRKRYLLLLLPFVCVSAQNMQMCVRLIEERKKGAAKNGNNIKKKSQV